MKTLQEQAEEMLNDRFSSSHRTISREGTLELMELFATSLISSANEEKKSLQSQVDNWRFLYNGAIAKMELDASENKRLEEELWDEFFTFLYYEGDMSGGAFSTDTIIELAKAKGYSIEKRKE